MAIALWCQMPLQGLAALGSSTGSLWLAVLPALLLLEAVLLWGSDTSFGFLLGLLHLMEMDPSAGHQDTLS